MQQSTTVLSAKIVVIAHASARIAAAHVSSPHIFSHSDAKQPLTRSVELLVRGCFCAVREGGLELIRSPSHTKS